MNSWKLLPVLVSAVTACAADIDSASLLSLVQSNVRENANRMPRYVCRQRIQRKAFTQLEPRLTVTLHPGCAALAEQGLPKVPSLTPALTDRAYLDVMLAGDKELFSWPGGRSFDTEDPDELLGGGLSGSGDFANFVINIFSNASKVTFEYMGACPGGQCVRYGYVVPVETSGYIVKSRDKVGSRLGFHGTFDVDPQSANIIRMSVIATDPSHAIPEACAIRTRMSYTSTAAETREFMIPKSTEMEYLSKDGSYSVSDVVYEGCRQYTSESKLTFGEDIGSALRSGQAGVSQALPVVDTELQLRLASRVDSELASAGDNLQATALVRRVPDAGGGTISAGTVFRGHLTQLERVYIPQRQLLVGMRFDTIVFERRASPDDPRTDWQS